MQKQNGFTLVELVVVIIILGILAVTAAPKFINMQADARLSTLQGVKGAINGANVMVYAKSSLEGQSKSPDGKVHLNNQKSEEIRTAYGYVRAETENIQMALDLNGFDEGKRDKKGTDWIYTRYGHSITIQQKNSPAACRLTYTEASSTALPSFTLPKVSQC